MKTYSVMITGHRPNDLPWGYSNPTPIINKFVDTLKEISKKHKNIKIITGMALGMDTIFGLAAIKLKEELKEKGSKIKIILEAAVPCKYQEMKWRQEAKDTYYKILSNCDKITNINGYQKYTNDCMQKRNEYMVDNADLIIAVYNGKKTGGTYNCLRYAKETNKKIVEVTPEKLNEYKYKKIEL